MSQSKRAMHGFGARRVAKLASKLAAAALASLAGAGCTSDGEDLPLGAVEVTFGAAISRTGSSAVDTWVNAFQLAADDANAGLRMAGYPQGPIVFRTVIADSRNQAATAVAKTKRMLASDNIKMALNGTSADSAAMLALNYGEEPRPNIPIVCVACSSPSHHNPMATDAKPEIQAAYRNQEGWHFGLSMSSTPQSLVLARIIVGKGDNGDQNGDGKLKVSTVYIDDAFGRGFAAVLKTAILRFRPDAIIEQISHPADNALLNNLGQWSETVRLLTDNRTEEDRDADPDIVLEITFPQYSLAILKAYTAGGYKVPFLHTHSMRESTVLIQAGSSLIGHEGTSYLPLDGEAGTIFQQRFRETVGIDGQSQWDGHVYDGYFLTALATLMAVRDLGGDATRLTGVELREAMTKVNDPDGTTILPGPDQFAKAAALIKDGQPINYQGASGNCDFDQYGRARNKIAHWSVEDKQRFKDLEVYDCMSNPDDCPRMME